FSRDWSSDVCSSDLQYWLSVGAQPTEPVLALLKLTGGRQKFKGLPGAEGSLKVKEPKPSKLELFNQALAEAEGAPSTEAAQPKKEKAAAKKADDKAGDKAEAKAEKKADEKAEAKAGEKAEKKAGEKAEAAAEGSDAAKES